MYFEDLPAGNVWVQGVLWFMAVYVNSFNVYYGLMAIKPHYARFKSIVIILLMFDYYQ